MAAWTIVKLATAVSLQERFPTFGSSEVNHISVILEHVDLLNSLDWLYIELLQRGLKLLVIGSRSFVNLPDYATRRAFSTA